MHISLRCDEKIYINGAVIRADRKVRIELLNDANFLLEAHVMQAKDATTPLRQLYFIVQMMLMAPNDTAAARALFDTSTSVMSALLTNRDLLAALADVGKLVDGRRYFEALKRIRGVLPLDPLPATPTAPRAEIIPAVAGRAA